jgi:hypothetical protein
MIKTTANIDIEFAIGLELLRAEKLYHNSVLYGDRFDGTPNFDDARGARDALYRLAEALKVRTVPADRLQEVALQHIEREHAGTVREDDVAEYTACVMSGHEWEVC